MHERRRAEDPKHSTAARREEVRPPALDWASAAGSAAVARLARERQDVPGTALQQSPAVLARTVLIDELDPTAPEAPAADDSDAAWRPPMSPRWEALAEDAATLVGDSASEDEQSAAVPDMLPPGGHAPIEQDELY